MEGFLFLSAARCSASQAKMGEVSPLTPEYMVFKIPVETIKSKDGESPDFITDCEIRKVLTPASAKKLKRKYGTAVTPYPAQGWERGQRKKRWHLKVGIRNGASNEISFCRVVGFACLSYRSRKLQSDFCRYQIDHVKSRRKWDCALKNLRIRTVKGHFFKTQRERRGLRRPAARCRR